MKGLHPEVRRKLGLIEWRRKALHAAILKAFQERVGHKVNHGAVADFNGAIKRIVERAAGEIVAADKTVIGINKDQFRVGRERGRWAGMGNLPAFEIIEKHFVAVKIWAIDRRIVEDDLDVKAAGLGVAQKKEDLRHRVLMLFQVGIDHIGADVDAAASGGNRGADRVLESKKVDEKERHRGRGDVVVKHRGSLSDHRA